MWSQFARWCGRGLLLSAGLTLGGCANLSDGGYQPLPAALDARATLAVVGDLQMTPWLVRRLRGREYNGAEQAQLLADLGAQPALPGALLISGDLVFSAHNRRNWQHFDRILQPLARQMPVLPALGNHDYYCVFVALCSTRVVPAAVRARFPWLQPGQGYALAWGRVLVVWLDSETGLAAQAAWLRAQLAAARGAARLALVVFHRPPYTNSMDRGAHGDPGVRQHFLPALDAAALPSVVLNGHIHGLEHLARDARQYITTAGGGGPRGWLAPERPHDVYAGRECARRADGAVLRPFHYLLLGQDAAGLSIDVRGLCRGDPAVTRLTRQVIPWP